MANKKPYPSKDASSSTNTKSDSLSLLYCRVNGFLLGCFQSLIRYRFARPEFAIHRSRILEFFKEAGIDVTIPANPDLYDRQGDALMRRVTLAAKQRSPELGDFASLGTVCSLDAALRQGGERPSDALRNSSVDFMDSRGMKGADLYERFLANVRRTADSTRGRGISIQSILSPALELLTAMIEPLQGDPAMCFVAMPFAKPFSGYYSLLYRPIANHMECSSFRMWGGLSGEEYVDLMLAVIRRCGILLADLTTLNPNVIYEVGVARGLGKKVVLLCQSRDVTRVPANIGSDQLLLSYSPNERGWPSEVVRLAAVQAASMGFAREIQEEEISGARRSPGQALPVLGVFHAEKSSNQRLKTAPKATANRRRMRPVTKRR